MQGQMAKRLASARQQRFVGRRAELELLRTAFMRELPDVAVIHFHGPGGVGKSSLLRQAARLAEEAGCSTLMLDGRHLDPSPNGFLTAMQVSLGLPSDQSTIAVTAAIPNLVLLLDTYELMAPLDGWLREEFLPQLSEQALVVMAGRYPPSPLWRGDDGWGALTRIVSLRNLLPDESAAYLRSQGLPESAIDSVLGVTYGHPLALSLAADLFRQKQVVGTFDLKEEQNTVRILLERFVADVPSPVLRQALEVCAHAFNTDEALLAHCLGEAEAYHAFEWLRGLSFIEHGPFGLYPHDLAREVLEVDLRWRNLNRFREVHFQVREHIIHQVRIRTGLAQQYAIFALLFLHRNNPFMRPFYEWQSFGQTYIDLAQAEDMPAIEAMVVRHQGAASLAVTRFWRNRPESTFYVFRAAEQTVAGFGHVLTLTEFYPELLEADPAVRAAAAHLREVPPLQQGDVVLIFRNWMDAEYYQDSPSIFNMGAMICLRLYFQQPNLAYSLIAQANSDHYAMMFEYLRTPLAPKARFEMDGQHFGVFVHDWRAEPVLKWIDLMGERELLDEIIELETLSQPTQPVVLSEPEFADAVRHALKELSRPDQLAHNPLLRSRCLRDRSDITPTPVLLQSLLREGVETLTAHPRLQKLHRVLWHTYFEPAPTQEVAAELLDLPFSTYRYQLAKAVDHLVDWLWQQELYGVDAMNRASR